MANLRRLLSQVPAMRATHDAGASIAPKEQAMKTETLAELLSASVGGLDGAYVYQGLQLERLHSSRAPYLTDEQRAHAEKIDQAIARAVPL